MNEFIPIVAQDYQTGEVRMVGVGNEESIDVSDTTGRLTFWSRTKGCLWTKGETSGDFLEIWNPTRVMYDFESDVLRKSIVYQVRQVVGKTGMTCHKGTPTCFGSEEFTIQNRSTLQCLNYAKMNGRALVVIQEKIGSRIVGVRMLDEINIKSLLDSLLQKYGGNGSFLIDCDNDTILIRI